MMITTLALESIGAGGIHSPRHYLREYSLYKLKVPHVKKEGDCNPGMKDDSIRHNGIETEAFLCHPGATSTTSLCPVKGPVRYAR
jgi:hypothetical protein